MLSGLPADTLRAWERRYEAVVPDRVNGRRLYSQQDVQRLKLLKWAVDHGHRIGRIAGLSEPELLRLRDSAAQVDPSQVSEVAPQVQDLIALIKDFNSQADLELARLAGLMNPREFVFEIVLPLMREIGVQWHSGELTVAQEHLTSATVRNVLGSLIRVYGVNPNAPAIAFATTPGDLHEFGVLVAAMIAAINGFRSLYFGADLPLRDLADAAKRTQALAVVISLSPTLPKHEIPNRLTKLRQLLPPNTRLIIGGIRSENTGTLDLAHTWIAPSFEVFEELLLDLKRSSRAFPN